jgi:chromosome segregation ATPase
VTTEAETAQLLQRLDKVERRLDTHERNASDLGKSITAIVDNHKALGDRLSTVEKAEFQKQIDEAVAAEREKQLQANISRMSAAIDALVALNLGQVKTDVGNIKSDNNKLFWLVLGAVVTGFIGIGFLVFKNGLGL